MHQKSPVVVVAALFDIVIKGVALSPSKGENSPPPPPPPPPPEKNEHSRLHQNTKVGVGCIWRCILCLGGFHGEISGTQALSRHCWRRRCRG